MGSTQQSSAEIYSTLFNIKDKWKKLNSDSKKNVTSENSYLLDGVEAEESKIPIGELLFFSTYLRKHYLGELIAIKSKKGAWIELKNFFELLNFAITVNNENLTAQGWYVSEDTHFFLDIKNKTVEINGIKYTLLEQDYYLDAGEIHIALEILDNWFRLGVVLDFNSLELGLSPKKLLPLDKKLQREQRSLYTSSLNIDPTLPWKASPYQSTSSPVADFQLNHTATQERQVSSYSLLGSQDLAYFNSEYYLTGMKGDLITDSRLSFNREHANADLLGPINATSLQFGDVLATQIGSRFLGSYARGIKVGNIPLNREVNNNQVTLTGAIQAGWDIELYRNKVLIEQQLSLSDGRYLFENIDLLFGMNTFELIFYGPQGQVERKVEEFIIDGNSLDLGEAFYEFSITQQGKQLLSTSNNTNGQQGWMLSGRYERGITDYLSVYSGVSLLNSDDGDDINSYAFGSNLSVLNKILINLDYEQNSNQETELRVATRTELAEQSVRLSLYKTSRLLNGSESNDFYNKIDTYELFFSGRVMDNRFGQLSYQNTASYTMNNERDSLFRFGNTLNYSLSQFSLNNNLQWADNETFYGNSRIQTRFGRISARFGVNYSVEPESEITSYETEFSRSIKSNLQVDLKLTHQLENNIEYAELGLNWQADLFSVNSNFNYDTDNNWRVGLFGRFSLGFDTKNNNHFFNKQSLAQTGSLIVHVFLDENNNGVFDKGERKIEGVKVKALQNYRRAITDENGIALLAGMPANLITDVVIDPDSFSDPFLIAANDGFSITPRAGFVEYMDIPLNNSSEVEGTIYKDNETLGFATVQLLDKNGKEVAQTQAAYDGYYLFTDLRPGQYQAVVDDSFKERKALKNTQQVNVELSAKGDVLVGVDFTLKPLEHVSGTIVNAGSFSSLMMLKTYLRLISPRLTLNQQEVFYIHDQQQNKYILALGYAERAQPEFAGICQSLITQGLKCELEQRTILH